MVKTTYALTLFAAVSLAAPLPPAGSEGNGVDHMRRDGTGNLLGAGNANGAVNEMVKGLADHQSDHPASLDEGHKMDSKAAEIKAADKKQKQENEHSILEELPVVGSLLRPGNLVGDSFRKRGEMYHANKSSVYRSAI